MIIKEIDIYALPPTPEAFKKRIQEMIEIEDIEDGHMKLDDYLCDVLESLGFKEGVDILRQTPKWYA